MPGAKEPQGKIDHRMILNGYQDLQSGGSFRVDQEPSTKKSDAICGKLSLELLCQQVRRLRRNPSLSTESSRSQGVQTGTGLARIFSKSICVSHFVYSRRIERRRNLRGPENSGEVLDGRCGLWKISGYQRHQDVHFSSPRLTFCLRRDGLRFPHGIP